MNCMGDVPFKVAVKVSVLRVFLIFFTTDTFEGRKWGFSRGILKLGLLKVSGFVSGFCTFLRVIGRQDD